MKKNTMMVNILLAVVLGIGLLVGMIWRTYMPYVVLPELDVTAYVGISLIALVLEYFFAGTQKRNWVLQVVYAAATFILLALVAGVAHNGYLSGLWGRSKRR